MRHPSEFFIKYLISLDHPRVSENTWLSASLELVSLPPLQSDTSEQYLAFLREDMSLERPTPFLPNKDSRDKESIKYIKDRGVFSMHNPDSAVREATTGILGDTQIRPMVETLLLGRVDHKEVAKRVNEKKGVFLRAESVAAYEHYYWNVNLLTVEDWCKLFDGTKKARTVESVLMGGKSVALFQLGYSGVVETKDVLQETLEAMYFDLKDWKAQPRSDEKTKALSLIAKSVTLLDEQLSQSESAIKESLKAFEKFRINQIEGKPPDIKRLAPAGNYSGSGAKEKQEEKVGK